MQNSDQQPVHWVTDNAVLAQLCEKWADLPAVAVDSEFMRTNTFYPIPALVQVNDGSANYLLDPLELTQWQPFCDLLVNPLVQKVLHSCSEDLEVFQRLLGVLPAPVFDTQIAAAATGYGFSVGYAKLVNTVLGVELPQGETRSDWLQRPLSQAQHVYAAEDVQYLFMLAENLRIQLLAQGRLTWVLEEYQLLQRQFYLSQVPENALNRIKGAWRLSPRSLAALVRLAAWRERTAAARDLPRNHVVKEQALYTIAQRLPQHIGQLHDVEELSERAIRRYGDLIIALVAEACALAESELPEPLVRPLRREQNLQAKYLRQQLHQLAEQLGIAPELLARKKDYEHWARSLADGIQGRALLPSHFPKWRADLVLPVLEQIV